MSSNATMFGNNPRRFAITIPDNTGTGSTILTLLTAAGYTGPNEFAFKILANQPNSATDRAAFVAATPRGSAAITATDFTTHGQYVLGGIEYAEPSLSDAYYTYVRSATASTVSALCVVVF